MTLDLGNRRFNADRGEVDAPSPESGQQFGHSTVPSYLAGGSKTAPAGPVDRFSGRARNIALEGTQDGWWPF